MISIYSLQWQEPPIFRSPVAGCNSGLWTSIKPNNREHSTHIVGIILGDPSMLLFHQNQRCSMYGIWLPTFTPKWKMWINKTSTMWGPKITYQKSHMIVFIIKTAIQGLHTITGWWYTYLPLWKIWVRQLGLWNSQYMEKSNSCSKPPTK